MQGWIKLHRKFLDWEWYDDINTKVLFMHLLLKANHKEKKYRGQIIQRGQLLTGRELLAEETGLSIQAVRTSIIKLKSTSELTSKSTSKGSLVTIVNYDMYQDSTEQSTSTSTSTSTDEQPATNQLPTTNKNVNNENNENNTNNGSPSAPVIQKSKSFQKPTQAEISAHMLTKGSFDDSERFFNFYESNGWKVGKNPMKNWKACINNWLANHQEKQQAQMPPKIKIQPLGEFH